MEKRGEVKRKGQRRGEGRRERRRDEVERKEEERRLVVYICAMLYITCIVFGLNQLMY